VGLVCLGELLLVFFLQCIFMFSWFVMLRVVVCIVLLLFVVSSMVRVSWLCMIICLMFSMVVGVVVSVEKSVDVILGWLFLVSVVMCWCLL